MNQGCALEVWLGTRSSITAISSLRWPPTMKTVEVVQRAEVGVDAVVIRHVVAPVFIGRGHYR